MAKAPPPQASSSKATAQSQPKKRPAAFEIDDIFASKKSKPTAPTPTPTSATPAEPESNATKKKQKNKGKGKAIVNSDPDAMDIEQDEDAEMKSIGDAIMQAKKATQRVPETIVDSSRTIEAYRPAPPSALGRKRKAGETVDEADEKFMDSRGTSELSFKVQRDLEETNLVRYRATNRRWIGHLRYCRTQDWTRRR